jgi:hypothetical protein
MACGTIQRNTLTRGTQKKTTCFEYVLSRLPAERGWFRCAREKEVITFSITRVFKFGEAALYLQKSIGQYMSRTWPYAVSSTRKL